MAAPRTKECARLKEKCITAPSTPRSHHHHHRGRPPSPRMSIPGSPGRKFSEKPVASFRRPTVSSSLHTNSPPDKPHYPPFITGLAKHPPPRKPPEKFSSLTHPHPRSTYSTPVGIFDERPPRTPSSFAKFCSGKASSSVRSGRTQTLSSEWSGGLKRKRKDGNGSLPRISSVPEMVVQEEEEPPREIEMEESETVSIASIEEHLLPEELPDPDPDPIEPKDLDVIVDSSPPPPPQTDGHLAPIIEQCEPSSSEEVAEIIHEDFQGVEEPEEAGDDGEKLEDEIEKTIVVESSTLSAELQKKSVFFEEEEEETEDKPKEVLEESSILSAEEAIQKQEEEEAKEMSVMMEASTSHAAEPEKEETVLQKEEELPDKAKAEKEAATVAAAAKKSEKEETVLQKEEELPDKAKAEEEAATAAAAAKKPESGVQGRKKKDAAKSNDVIEETKTKLMEKRKSKVLALVGAFETVMHLHEPDA